MKSIDNSHEKYWRNNFSNTKIVNISDDLQINIARTKKGKRISKEDWLKTIDYLINLLSLNKNSNVLELCCGNGVVIGELAPLCNIAFGIDYSNELLSQLSEHYRYDNLNIVCSDINSYDIEISKFDTIILYFSIQHFNERNTFLIIEKSLKSLKIGGKLLIGDIPDVEKKWKYINKQEYHLDYFKRVVTCTPKIGYWFQKAFFKAMNSCFLNANFIILSQPNYQINSDHCFDVLIEKNGII